MSEGLKKSTTRLKSRALSRSSVTLSDVNAARSPSKQHRSVSVHLFECFGGSITTSASFPSQFFFKNPGQLLSDRTPRLSFLKEKNPLWLFWGSIFSSSPLTPAEQDPNVMETIWNTTSLPVSCSRTPGEADFIVFPPHIYKTSISMFLGSWTAAVVVSKIFIKQNQQENQAVTTAVWSPALQNSRLFLTLMKCSLLSAARWGQRYKRHSQNWCNHLKHYRRASSSWDVSAWWWIWGLFSVLVFFFYDCAELF